MSHPVPGREYGVNEYKSDSPHKEETRPSSEKTSHMMKRLGIKNRVSKPKPHRSKSLSRVASHLNSKARALKKMIKQVS